MRNYSSSIISDKHNNSIVYALKNITSADLKNYNLTKYINLIIFLLIKTVNLLDK